MKYLMLALAIMAALTNAQAPAPGPSDFADNKAILEKTDSSLAPAPSTPEAFIVTPAPAPVDTDPFDTPAPAPAPGPGPADSPPPPCNQAAPPFCKMFLQDTLCCEDVDLVGGDTGLVSTKPWVDVSILCTEETDIRAECIDVSGPSNYTVIPIVGSGYWGKQFRFVASWAGADTNVSGFNGTVTIGLKSDPSYCTPALYKGVCSVGPDNYDSIKPIEPVSLEVIPAPEYCDNFVTCMEDDWATNNYAWVNSEGECRMLATGLLPADFFPAGFGATINSTWYRFEGGYSSTCAGNASEPVPRTSVPEELIFDEF